MGGGAVKVAEIQTHTEPDAEWITIHKREGYVSIYVEYVDPDGDRIAWQDSGLSVRDEHLDKLIVALQACREVAKSEAVSMPITAPYVGPCKRSGRYKMVSDTHERVSKLYCDAHATDWGRQFPDDRRVEPRNISGERLPCAGDWQLFPHAGDRVRFVGGDNSLGTVTRVIVDVKRTVYVRWDDYPANGEMKHSSDLLSVESNERPAERGK